jgi:hypothetical protein
MTAIPRIVLLVELDDGREFKAEPDQRDYRRATVICGIDPALDPLGFTIAQAWSVLQRTGAYEEGWPEFERTCRWAMPDTDLEADAAAVDPTTADGAG